MPDDARSPLDNLILALLVALLAFMPLAFGAVDAWAEFVAFAAASVIALLLALRGLLVGGKSQARASIAAPIILFIALALLQLAPLPARAVRAISPRTLTMKSDLLHDLPNAPDILQKTTL